jgi:regulator of protease activity HflC (stomatin/prohibitin superfamily)
MPISLVIALIFAVFVLILLAKTAVVVPQQSAYVVERLGKYHSTLGAGFCILLPFMDGRAQSRSATFHFGMMLHGQVLRAVEFI